MCILFQTHASTVLLSFKNLKKTPTLHQLYNNTQIFYEPAKNGNTNYV